MGSVRTYIIILFLSLAISIASADPDFEVFKDGLLLQVDKFDKSETEVAYLVSFLNPTESVVKTSAPIRQILPQSVLHKRMLVVPRDADFIGFVKRVKSMDDFRIKLFPKEQRTYVFEPEGRTGGEEIPAAGLSSDDQ